MRRRMLALLLMLVAAPAPAMAQALVLLPGTQVMVQGRFNKVSGYVESVQGDTLRLMLSPGSAAVPISLDNVQHLYVFERRSKMRGASYGALWGAALFAPIIAVSCASDFDECRKDWEIDPSRGDGATLGTAALTGGVVGAALGAAIGAIVPSMHTTEVKIPARTTIQVSPRGQLAVQFRF